MNQALLSSKNMNWCTPQDFFDKLDLEFGFVLDAAATNETAKCQRYYTPETDGLAQSWQCDGAVFCNPPYGRKLGKWVQKAWQEAQTGQTIVLLIPARTDTAYFHDFIYGKAEIRFLRGRLRFTDEAGNTGGSAPFPSMVVVYNREAISKAGGSPLSEWDTVGVVGLVANQPAADVAPVRRGHWERDRDTIKCSECGFGMFPIRPAFRDGDCVPYSGVPNHCPDCGLRMEVEPHEQPESHY